MSKKKERISTNPFKKVKDEKVEKTGNFIKDIENNLLRRNLNPSNYTPVHKAIISKFIEKGFNIDKIKDPKLNIKEVFKQRDEIFKNNLKKKDKK